MRAICRAYIIGIRPPGGCTQGQEQQQQHKNSPSASFRFFGFKKRIAASEGFLPQRVNTGSAVGVGVQSEQRRAGYDCRRFRRLQRAVANDRGLPRFTPSLVRCAQRVLGSGDCGRGARRLERSAAHSTKPEIRRIVLTAIRANQICFSDDLLFYSVNPDGRATSRRIQIRILELSCAMAKDRKVKTISRKKGFDAALERMRSRLNWVIIRVPFDAVKAFGVRGQIKVRGTINGFPFRTSLFPTREGAHILLVNKRMQKEARVAAGASARFELEPDTEERVAIVPAPLQRILAQGRLFRRWYDQLNHSMRYEIAKWVNGPESTEARGRRAEQIAERLLETMEAERELPPLLQLALARNPQAREGWDRMSLARRRSHLLGIFYYRTPAGRANRIGKMLEDATAIAEKRNSRGK